MLEQAGRLLSAVDDLYLAGLGHISWPEAMKSVADVCGGAGGVTFDMDRDSLAISRWDGHGVEPDGSEYAARMNGINPRMHASLAEPGPHLMWDYRFTDESGIGRHEFYDWLSLNDGLRYFVGGRIGDRGRMSTFASVEFTARQGHPGRETIEAFGLLARHLDAARVLEGTGSTLGPGGTGDEFAPSSPRPAAAFAVDRAGKIVHLNATADGLVMSGDIVGLRRGKLVFGSPRLDGAFHARLDLLCRGSEWARAVADLPVETRATERSPGLLLRVLPVPGVAEQATSERIAAIALLERVELSVKQLVVALWERHGLSRREAQLAAALREAASLPAAAARLGISPNTARVHLQRVYEKTGLHSQMELALAVERLARS